MLELLIRDGLIIDGTGSPGFYGAIGVEGDTVRILRGDLSSVQAARVIDAPIGIEYVIVNGKVVVDQSQHTGMLAGRALRRGRAST